MPASATHSRRASSRRRPLIRRPGDDLVDDPAVRRHPAKRAALVPIQRPIHRDGWVEICALARARRAEEFADADLELPQRRLHARGGPHSAGISVARGIIGSCVSRCCGGRTSPIGKGSRTRCHRRRGSARRRVSKSTTSTGSLSWAAMAPRRRPSARAVTSATCASRMRLSTGSVMACGVGSPGRSGARYHGRRDVLAVRRSWVGSRALGIGSCAAISAPARGLTFV